MRRSFWNVLKSSSNIICEVIILIHQPWWNWFQLELIWNNQSFKSAISWFWVFFERSKQKLLISTLMNSQSRNLIRKSFKFKKNKDSKTKMNQQYWSFRTLLNCSSKLQNLKLLFYLIWTEMFYFLCFSKNF